MRPATYPNPQSGHGSGAWLREIRRHAGLSQKQLADLWDMRRATIGAYERADRLPAVIIAAASWTLNVAR